MPPMTTAASGTMRAASGANRFGRRARWAEASRHPPGTRPSLGTAREVAYPRRCPGRCRRQSDGTRVGNRIEAMRKERREMSGASHLCMLLTEIGNEDTMERHIAEVAQRTTPAEMVDWVKSRDDHLEDELRGGGSPREYTSSTTRM